MLMRTNCRSDLGSLPRRAKAVNGAGKAVMKRYRSVVTTFTAGLCAALIVFSLPSPAPAERLQLVHESSGQPRLAKPFGSSRLAVLVSNPTKAASPYGTSEGTTKVRR